MNVMSVVKNKDFNPVTFDHDIAILKLEKDLKFNTKISPVCLPQQDETLPEGTECFLSGIHS